MDSTDLHPSRFFAPQIKAHQFSGALFDYTRYNPFDVNLFDDNGKLNKRMNLFPLDERVYDASVLKNIDQLDETLTAIDKQRAVLFPLFAPVSPLTRKRLHFQLDVLLVPLLDVSNRVIAHYYHNEPISTIKERHRLAAELNSVVRFLQAIHNDMHRYRELALLEATVTEEIHATRGYLTLHDTLTEQTPMELEPEDQDFHGIYLHDRLLHYRDKALDKALHKLRAERAKLKIAIDKALLEFEQQYSREIQNRTDVIRTLNGYLGDTFLNEIIPGQGYDVLPSGRRRNIALSKYLNTLLPLYSALRKLAIENDIFDTLQAVAKRSLLATQHN